MAISMIALPASVLCALWRCMARKKLFCLSDCLSNSRHITTAGPSLLHPCAVGVAHFFAEVGGADFYGAAHFVEA
jgi:hypothetical protein